MAYKVGLGVRVPFSSASEPSRSAMIDPTRQHSPEADLKGIQPMTDHIQSQISAISSLPDDQILTLYGCCAKVLLARGKLALTKKALKKVLAQSQPNTHDTPPAVQRGRVKRISTHSVLIDFLSEDWGHLFTGEYSEEKIYYVYYHTDPSMPDMRFRRDSDEVVFRGRPFYIGKGVGDRYKSLKRSRSHISVVNRIAATGIRKDEIFHIFKGCISEKEALELEAKLITFFGCWSELDRNRAHFHGMKGGLLINSDPAVRPPDVADMMKIKGAKIL